MYLRETRRRNRDGSEVAYLALAHNERDRDTGVPKAQIIHNFGRADRVDREGLARLVKSISRFLDPADAVAAAADGEVVILDSRPMGTAWVADQLWQRLGIGAQIIEVVGRRRGPGRRVDAAVVERVIFAMVANRLSPTPLSKLAGCAWVAHRVFIDGLAEVDEDSCYRAMDVFLSVLAELQQAVFFSVANLLNLEVDILFFDTSSTYWETAATSSAPAGTTSWARSCGATPRRPPPRCRAKAATRWWPATCGSKRSASTTPPGTASSSATTPTPPSGTPRCATRSWPASPSASPAPTPCRPASAPSWPASSRPSQRSPGSCAPPPAACCASTAPRCAPTPTSTASSCYAPATRASPPPTSPRAIRASTKPNEAGGTS